MNDTNYDALENFVPLSFWVNQLDAVTSKRLDDEVATSNRVYDALRAATSSELTEFGTEASELSRMLPKALRFRLLKLTGAMKPEPTPGDAVQNYWWNERRAFESLWLKTAVYGN